LDGAPDSPLTNTIRWDGGGEDGATASAAAVAALGPEEPFAAATDDCSANARRIIALAHTTAAGRAAAAHAFAPLPLLPHGFDVPRRHSRAARCASADQIIYYIQMMMKPSLRCVTCHFHLEVFSDELQ
jgi:hypothetical protein